MVRHENERHEFRTKKGADKHRMQSIFAQELSQSVLKGITGGEGASALDPSPDPPPPTRG